MLKYFEHGKGNVLFLLHGYLEQKEMWSDVLKKAPEGLRIICPDLPGHGESTVHKNQSIESMADSVLKLADKLEIEQFHIAGHSMGGYVSLAIADICPKRILSLTMLHSHPFADPPEKKENRLRETKLLRDERKKEMIIRFSIPNLFSADYSERNPDIVGDTILKALTTSTDGMIACLTAMAGRPDRSVIPEKANFKTLFILGKKDNLISWEKISERYKDTHVNIVFLENSGHMGMIEENELFCRSFFRWILNRPNSD